MSMEQKAINLKSLTMDELAGVVNLYPWYGAARKELCQRMAGMGGESWGVSQFSDQAMYVGDRGMIAEIMRQGKSDDYADNNKKYQKDPHGQKLLLFRHIFHEIIL